MSRGRIEALDCAQCCQIDVTLSHHTTPHPPTLLTLSHNTRAAQLLLDDDPKAAMQSAVENMRCITSRAASEGLLRRTMDQQMQQTGAREKH
jgi:hypothetical protein